MKRYSLNVYDRRSREMVIKGCLSRPMCPPEKGVTEDIIVRRIFFLFFKIQICSNGVNFSNLQKCTKTLTLTLT